MRDTIKTLLLIACFSCTMALTLYAPLEKVPSLLYTIGTMSALILAFAERDENQEQNQTKKEMRNIRTFEASAFEWAKVAGHNKPKYEDLYKKLTLDEKQEFIDEPVKGSLNAKKEALDWLWCACILKEVSTNNISRAIANQAYSNIMLFYPWEEIKEIAEAVKQSNYSKFTLVQDATISDMASQATEIVQAGRYTGVVPIKSYCGKYWLLLDHKKKVLKPKNYREYTDFLF